VFDDPNILLRLHVERVNILRDIAIFIFGQFGLKLPIHAHFGRVLEDMTGFPLELGSGVWRKGSRTRVLGLPDGRNSFKIGLAVLTQYRRVTASQPASHLSIASTALCFVSHG